MAKPFKNLVDKMSVESLAKAEAIKKELVQDISLRQLRSAVQLTQESLAKKLGVGQAAISKIESQSDMYISTLRRSLEGMGYTLKIIAKSATGEVTIGQFKDVAEPRRKKIAAR